MRKSCKNTVFCGQNVNFRNVTVGTHSYRELTGEQTKVKAQVYNLSLWRTVCVVFLPELSCQGVNNRTVDVSWRQTNASDVQSRGQMLETDRQTDSLICCRWSKVTVDLASWVQMAAFDGGSLLTIIQLVNWVNNQPTNNTQMSYSWKADSHPAGEENSLLLSNTIFN